MRNNYDFEQLVFEKAGNIKAHDRRRKIVISTVTPLAAALVILTTVGLRTLSFSPDSFADRQDAAGAAIGGLYSENATKPSENYAPKSMEEDNADYDLYDNIAQEDGDYLDEYAEQYSEEVQNDNAGAADSLSINAAAPQAAADSYNTVIFTANETIVLNGEAADEIEKALSEASLDDYKNESENGSYLGTITVDDDEYKIFYDHAEVQNQSGTTASFALDDEAKKTLEKYLPIDFG